LQKPTVFWITF